MWATCHVETCSNNGWPMDVGDTTWTDEESGITYDVATFCGVCGNQITDISATKPPDPPEPEPEPEPPDPDPDEEWS